MSKILVFVLIGIFIFSGVGVMAIDSFLYFEEGNLFGSSDYLYPSMEGSNDYVRCQEKITLKKEVKLNL